MAAGAGIGGGILFVGIFYLILRYSSSLAVPLSNFAIFGAFALVCFLNGLVAGMLGAGAGTITSFILVEMKLNPEVLTATSALIVLLASSSTAIQYLLIGLVPYAKGFWFFGVTLICFPIGKLTLNYLVRKYKRAALILFTFAIAITVSAVLMCYNTIDALLHQSHKNKISQFCN
ncbi:hypothetical protein M0811_00801 [Anaeramoeba ignava]|uniref:Uncharacterized protein n=1 Tax=Anaeramoeba ignava TaxID=1746090 RepID=A0A9Q0RBI7_ANAIG|nr:hypothetical protein M0811_00801 [Anaeramoeba ignava]